MEPRTKAYPANIFPYLLLATLPLLLSGQAQRAPHEVNGIVGGTALLSVIVPRNLHVVEVRWKFGSAGPDKVRLGDSKRGEFVPFDLSYTNYSQLIQRLDMSNETTLRIRNLTKGDGSGFKADVQFNDGSAKEEEFQLNVYDPVPEPQIKRTSFNCTSDGCNVTLACQVLTEQDLRIHWFKENISDSTRLNISDRRLLQVSLKTNKSSCMDSKYICVVSNPVDKKNSSTVVNCSVDTNLSPRVKSGVFIAVALVLIIVFLVCILYYLKKKKERMKADDKVVHSLVSHPQEEMTDCPGNKRRPPEGEEVTSPLKDDRRNLQQKETTLNTVYVELQHSLDNTLT